MIELRDYQLSLVDEARGNMRSYKNILVQAATGAGKTVLGAYMISNTIKKGFDCFFLVHRVNLVDQTSKTFDKFDIPHSFIAANVGYNPYHKVHICSIDTLKNRLKKVKVPKVIMVDECHLANSAGWSKVLDYYREQGCWIIGLSATPIRLDGTGLERHFQTMVTGPSMKWLIENGFLSEYRYFAPSTIDMSGVNKSNGDYAKGKMTMAVSSQHNKLVGDAIKHYRKHADGMRAIAYCVSVKESEQTAEDFNNAGIPAAHIDGETPLNVRKIIIKKFAMGEIKVLTNVELITTGFDLAAQVDMDVQVECIIQLRPTHSLSLYLQMVGRGLRADSKPHVIIDHAGNVQKHGLPCDDRDWSLQGVKSSGGKKGEKTIKTKDCPKCFHVHTPFPSCPNCGHVYEVKARELGIEEGELEEIKSASQIKKDKQKKEKDEYFRLLNGAKKRGVPNPALWAKNKMLAKKKGFM